MISGAGGRVQGARFKGQGFKVTGGYVVKWLGVGRFS
jgi:hypothetical protein